MTKFVAEITVGKRDRLVTLRIPAGNTIAPSLRQVSVTFDGETSHHHREPISSTVLEYHPMPGTHRLEIDFGGPMPAATLILPEQTTAIISPIPALYNDATGMLSTAGHIWNPIKPPRQLTHLVSSLFAHNTHLVALSGTFAGLTALTEVPESLFFPLIYARTFTGRVCLKRPGTRKSAAFYGQPSGRRLLGSLHGLQDAAHDSGGAFQHQHSCAHL